MLLEWDGHRRCLRRAAFGAVVSVLLLSLLFFVIGTGAFAQQPRWCDDRDAIVSTLEGRYGERLIGVGIIPAAPGRPSGLMSVYANAESGSWTITITAANETVPSGYASCVAASGEGFRLSPPPDHPS